MAFKLRSQSPIKQFTPPAKGKKTVEAGISADKETMTLSPYLNASSGKFNANASANISPEGKSFNAGLNYNKGGLSAGVGVEKVPGLKPNMTANISYSKTF